MLCFFGCEKEFVVTEEQTHGPGHSLPMFQSRVQRPLGYPGAPSQRFALVIYRYLHLKIHEGQPRQCETKEKARTINRVKYFVQVIESVKALQCILA